MMFLGISVAAVVLMIRKADGVEDQVVMNMIPVYVGGKYKLIPAAQDLPCRVQANSISALYAPPPALIRLVIWLMFRPMADRAAFIRLISVVSSWMIYPSIAIFRSYAPYRCVGSCAIFSSMSRFSSSVT